MVSVIMTFFPNLDFLLTQQFAWMPAPRRGWTRGERSILSGSGEQRDEPARRNRGADDARHVRAHGVHQQEVARIFLLADILRNARDVYKRQDFPGGAVRGACAEGKYRL